MFCFVEVSQWPMSKQAGQNVQRARSMHPHGKDGGVMPLQQQSTWNFPNPNPNRHPNSCSLGF